MKSFLATVAIKFLEWALTRVYVYFNRVVQRERIDAELKTEARLRAEALKKAETEKEMDDAARKNLGSL